MRRALLLITGLGVGGLLLFILCTGVAAQYRSLQEPSAAQLPWAVTGTQLTVVCLASYEGPFWEDGSDEEVAGIAALVVENAGGIPLAEGVVTLNMGEEYLVFEVYQLPVGTKALVLEKNRKTYCGQKILSCSGWSRGEYPENTGAVTAQESKEGIAVTNHAPWQLAGATVHYKHYDIESGMYIGGVVYSVEIDSLQPGETKTTLPYHYAFGYSRIVGIREGR